ncbi:MULTISPECIES: glycosyltransferase family 2 protein [Bifidobacterium]|uniref:glycosyltransferase family 2 protein n=1 Tax=Bifidobacterium TaxID=1678 RepID=UPI001BDD1865|nr:MULTISPECIES: glycosyltransferase family 2 protein [Bifidobacterium]MBT1162617.1 glycosyltransferase family 2 protein [Bifidobacterium sp. SO1]MBW3079768.1 glycosyltransferase family 2 protein [Bifidobacterium simiiventris]
MTRVSETVTPKVSIILPVYNVEKYLDRCFETICNQTFRDFEVLAVDDGSTDGSGAKCDAWAQKDGRIISLHKKNGGLSDARNYGLDRVRGEYITCIDSDDYVTEDYLEVLLSLFQYAPGCKMVGAGHYVARPKGNELDYHADKPVTVLSRREAFESVLYHGIVNVSAWAKMYHRSLFEHVRYPKGRLYEDTYIFGDLLNMTSSYVFASKPVYYYCKRDDSIVSGGYTSRRLEFINSVDRLVREAENCDPALHGACVRRQVHARLSVLRYMQQVSGADRTQRDELRRYVLANEHAILIDPKAPSRDKLAIRLLKMGYWAYYRCWALYELLRQ